MRRPRPVLSELGLRSFGGNSLGAQKFESFFLVGHRYLDVALLGFIENGPAQGGDALDCEEVAREIVEPGGFTFQYRDVERESDNHGASLKATRHLGWCKFILVLTRENINMVSD